VTAVTGLSTRRAFFSQSITGLAAAGAVLPFAAGVSNAMMMQTRELPPAGDRPAPPPDGVRILNPKARVPVSFIIDDSTCLVNLAHFAVPQFAEVFPDRYLQDWRKLPREIPDDFVRKFGDWCGERNIKGKYSIVPYPACVGRVDQRLPGWSRTDLENSLTVVRKRIVPNWDIHPEMVTHTFVINTRTGHPYEERSPQFMENWDWSVNKSSDELTDYLTYALQILKNAGLTCEGVTTPGGFGNRARPALSQATMNSCREVFNTEIPHYFRDLYTDDQSVVPLVQRASGLETDDPKCVVSIIGCTGDWFGSWDGLEKGSVDQFITADLKGGRLPKVIDKGEPAILVCHWPGIYFNGEEYGFNIFKEVVERLHQRYDHLLWMKLSEIARYWAAKELTSISRQAEAFLFKAPYGCPALTVELPSTQGTPQILQDGQTLPLKEVSSLRNLESGTVFRQGDRMTVCFDLQKGANELLQRI
jgi:hypothetical protein